MSGANEIRKQPTAKECEGFFRALFEQAAVGVVQVESRTGAFVRINRRYADIVGYTVAELEQLTFQQITHPEDVGNDLANMQRLLSGEIREFSVEKRYYHQDGSIVWVNVTVSPMWAVGDEPDNHLAVVEDITERKRAEGAMQEARDFAESLVETANAIVVVLGTEGEVKIFNSGAERITGYSLEEIGGKNWFETLVPRDRYPKVWGEFGRLLDGGIPQEYENPILTKGGEERHIVWKNNELIRHGEIVGTVSFGIDITERKRAEEALQKSEEQLRTVVQTMPVMVDAFDEGQNVIAWNRECERVTGYSAEEIIGNPDAMQLLYPDREYRERVMETVRKMEGDFRNLEFTLTSKNGESRTVLWSNLSTSHPIAGWATWAVGIDVTERQKAARQVRASTERLRLALQAASMGTWEWDVLANRVTWSPETHRIFGTTAEEFGGTYEAYLDFVAPEAREEIGNWVREFLENSGESSVIEYDHRIVRGNGEAGWVEVRGTLFLDEQGRPARMTGVCTDITDRKQAEKEREELIAQLEAQNTELERFTYTVSHDLKSPLITIKGYIGLLFEDLLEMDANAVKSDLSRISRAADKMGDLLDDLLELSRIGRLANLPENVSLGGLASEAVELLQGRLQGKRVQVDVASNLPVVYGDRTRLLEVLQNLIDNAVKYMGDERGPRIEIGSRQDEDETVCFVRDNGIGIDERFHDKVFGLFDQLDPTVEGTGIGLALVKRIIEFHGGRIWIESEGEGRGSTFCFTIPCKVVSPKTE